MILRYGQAALICAALSAAGCAGAETLRLYSYDPADATTRQAAGPLTFTFRKGLFHITLLNLRSTEAAATAYLKPVDDHALGRGGLSSVAGRDAEGRRLYEVKGDEEGAALISAFCPGAGRAWLAFGPLRRDQDLSVLVVGAPAKGGDAKLCSRLNFTFHGEWVLPPGKPFDARQLDHPRFPGG